MSETRLLTEQQGRVLTVRFSNPPRNFFDEQTGVELERLVSGVDRDSSVGAVVFTGEGLYVTHYSVPELLRGAESAPLPLRYPQASAYAALMRLVGRIGPLDRTLRRTPLRDSLTMPRLYRTFSRMNASDKVYIAAINGLAFGMGAILALQCDLRLMAEGEDYVFGLIETGISVLAAAGGTQRLVRMVGQSRAMEMLLEGSWVSPAQAAELGLVHRVVAPQTLQDEAMAIARRLAARSPLLNREIKRMVYDAGSRPARSAMRMEAASMYTVTTSRRARKDLASYLRQLERHESPTDRDIIDAWHQALGTTPAAGAASSSKGGTAVGSTSGADSKNQR